MFLTRKLPENKNTDIPHVIVNGIVLYGIADEEAKQQGHKLKIIDGNTVIREIEIDLS